VRRDARFDEVAEMGLQSPKRAFFVMAHQPAVTGDVDCQDRCELAFGPVAVHWPVKLSFERDMDIVSQSFHCEPLSQAAKIQGRKPLGA
jgi:hypothetical protein